MNWHEAAKVGDLDPETPRAVVIEGQAIAIYLVDGEPFAMGDLCPHQANVLLSDGFLEGGFIECPMHQSMFEIRTGRCLGPPANEDVPSYPVKVDGDRVMIGVK